MKRPLPAGGHYRYVTGDMRIFELARRPPTWLRAALASLMLALALDSLAHVAHSHGHDYDGRPGVDSALCGFCVSFDRVIDGPSQAAFRITRSPESFLKALPEAAPPVLRPVHAYVPRGPPAA